MNKLLPCLFLPLSVACTQSLHHLPTEGGPSWTLLESTHFELYTDDDPEEAERVLASFEHVYALLNSALIHTRGQTHIHTRIISVRSSSELREIVHSDAAGIYTPRLANDLQEHPTMIVRSEADRFNRTLFAHELTHRFNHVVFGPLPVWLNEGLAEYFATIHGETADPVVGDLDPYTSIAPGHVWGQSSSIISHGQVFPLQRLPSASELTLKPREDFYLWGQRDRLANELRGMNYASANALVHLLLDERQDVGAPFREAFEAALYGGQQADLQRVVNDLPLGELDTALEEYLSSSLSWRQTHEPAPPPVANVKVTELDDVDTLLLWAQLEDMRGDNGPLVQSYIERALQLQSMDPRALFWQGRYDMLLGDSRAAEYNFREVLRTQPMHREALLGLAILYQHPDHRDAWEAAGREVSLRHTMERLEKAAQSGDELNVVAIYHQLAGRHEAASRFAQRATNAAPACWSCLHTLAASQYAVGDVATAVGTEKRALLHLGEYTNPGAAQMVQQTLNAYQGQLTARDPERLDIVLTLPD